MAQSGEPVGSCEELEQEVVAGVWCTILGQVNLCANVLQFDKPQHKKMKQGRIFKRTFVDFSFSIVRIWSFFIYLINYQIN